MAAKGRRNVPLNAEVVLSAGLGLVLLATGSAPAVELPFTDATILTGTWSQPRKIVPADVNRDGAIDVLAVADDAGSLRLWRNTGSGSFAVVVLAAGLDAPSSLEVGDVDGDGDVDAIVGQGANVSGAGVGEVMWFANPEVGANTSWTGHVAAEYANAKVNDLALDDVDQDGLLDIIVARGVNDPALVWLENDGTPGMGTWPSHDIDDTYAGLAVTTADVDGDGDPDAVSRIPGASQMVWYEHDGTPTDHWTSHTFPGSVGYIVDVTGGDVTGNGFTDIVAAVPGTDDVILFEQDDGSWTRRDVAPVSINNPQSVEIVDMDFDGDLDILTSILYSDTVVWYENSGGPGATWTPRTIDDGFSDANSAIAADVDGDGDLDVAATGLFNDTVAWFENRLIHREIEFADPVTVRTGLGEPRGVEMADVNGDGYQDLVVAEWNDDTITLCLGLNDSGTVFLEQTIVSSFTMVRDVAIADMDRDGDLDIIGAAIGSDQVWWWANNGDAYPSWTSHPVLNDFDGAHMAEPADLDADGDLDLAVAAFDGDELAWVSNDDGAATSWTKYTIDGADGAHDAVIGDCNGDDKPDIVFSAYYGDVIKVALNPTGTGDFWGIHTVATGVNGPRGLALADFDDDGDLDIVGAIRLDNDITWFENDGTGINWTAHPVGSGLLIDGSGVRSADLNHDGDMDIVATSQSQNDIWVWQNGGGAVSWSAWKIETSLASPWAVAVGDLNRDGLADIAAAAGGTADTLLWYEGVGGQISVQGWSSAPGRIIGGEEDDLLVFRVWNHGRSASDGPIRPVSATVHFTDTEGTPLTSNQANQLIERLEVYADADGNGVFSAGDVRLIVDTYLTLADGALAIPFSGNNPEELIDPGNSQIFFVTVTATYDGWQQTPNTLRAAFPDDGLVAEDVTHQLPVEASPRSSVITPPVQIVEPPLFADDFESGDTSGWSATSP